MRNFFSVSYDDEKTLMIIKEKTLKMELEMKDFLRYISGGIIIGTYVEFHFNYGQTPNDFFFSRTKTIGRGVRRLFTAILIRLADAYRQS